MTAPTIAIVGGGFSGAALAYHLAAATSGASIHIIEPRMTLGAGVAYGDGRASDRLNVPAARMILDRSDTTAFSRWLGLRGLGDGETYASRHTFGLFVAEQLAQQVRQHGAVLKHHRTEALGLTEEGDALTIQLETGGTLRADAAVLCTGHDRPILTAELAHLVDDPGVIADPWAPNALDDIAVDARILLVGSGLTTADVAVALLDKGHRGALVATSRRGLIPRRSGTYPEPRGSFTGPARNGPAALLRAVRRKARAGDAGDNGWRAVLWALREQNGAIWQAWSAGQQSSFLRHLRPFWDVHRFQMAPIVADRLESAISAGQLRMEAGRIATVQRDGRGFAVTWQARRATPLSHRAVFDRIINCTGAGRRPREGGLVASLLADGLARRGRHGLGLQVDADARFDNGRSGRPALFALGTLTRGCLGEVSGASEIADQASRLAMLLARDVSAKPQPARRLATAAM